MKLITLTMEDGSVIHVNPAFIVSVRSYTNTWDDRVKTEIALAPGAGAWNVKETAEQVFYEVERASKR